MTVLTEHRPASPSPPPGSLASNLRGLTSDSREVRPGYLFAALPGRKADGRTFILDAIQAGASAVLAPAGTMLPPGAAGKVALITDENPRRRFALMAAEFHGAQPETIAAVTGTSGKTSTVSFARQMWEHLGRKAASLGTLGVTAPGMETYGALTTPDPATLHAGLADLATAGVTHLAMEASSHGLDQHRLDGVRVTAAGFTNLSRDHLDYHADMETYLAAKTRLFTEVLTPGGTAVLNADTPESIRIGSAVARAGRKMMTYGAKGADIRIEEIAAVAHGTQLKLLVRRRSVTLALPLVGPFQSWNALCALGLVMAGGVEDMDAISALGRLKGVRGRMELIGRLPSGASVYVDYAHKPGALEAVLTALRPHTQGALVCVFGCGGDRDAGKRPVMGGIAARLADRVIITDDNPRTEDAAAIRREIMAACPGGTEIGDRAEAIDHAIRGLGAKDLLVIAGKGHETGQIVGDTVRPFDDAETARNTIAALGGEAA